MGTINLILALRNFTKAGNALALAQQANDRIDNIPSAVLFLTEEEFDEIWDEEESE